MTIYSVFFSILAHSAEERGDPAATVLAIGKPFCRHNVYSLTATNLWLTSSRRSSTVWASSHSLSFLFLPISFVCRIGDFFRCPKSAGRWLEPPSLPLAFCGLSCKEWHSQCYYEVIAIIWFKFLPRAVNKAANTFFYKHTLFFSSAWGCLPRNHFWASSVLRRVLNKTKNICIWNNKGSVKYNRIRQYMTKRKKHWSI